MLMLVFNLVIFFFKQKTAYEMRISDWSSDVCSSDLLDEITAIADKLWEHRERIGKDGRTVTLKIKFADFEQITRSKTPGKAVDNRMMLTGIYEELLDSIMPLERPLRLIGLTISNLIDPTRSEEHTSELQSLMRISYAVFCLKKKTNKK